MIDDVERWIKAVDAIGTLSPFSPLVLHGEMPDDLVRGINGYIDRLDAGQRARLDYSKKLAGNVTNETYLRGLFRNEPAIEPFLLALGKRYFLQAENTHLNQVYGSRGKSDLRVTVEDFWANDMVAGDYSPVHFHTNCQLSCVGFLRTPEGHDAELADAPPHKRTAGCLQLIDGRTVFGGSNMLLIRPKVGTIVAFPAWMLHCVYPFRTSGIRRTFSANLSLQPSA